MSGVYLVLLSCLFGLISCLFGVYLRLLGACLAFFGAYLDLFGAYLEQNCVFSKWACPKTPEMLIFQKQKPLREQPNIG